MTQGEEHGAPWIHREPPAAGGRMELQQLVIQGEVICAEEKVKDLQGIMN